MYSSDELCSAFGEVELCHEGIFQQADSSTPGGEEHVRLAPTTNRDFHHASARTGAGSFSEAPVGVEPTVVDLQSATHQHKSFWAIALRRV